MCVSVYVHVYKHSIDHLQVLFKNEHLVYNSIDLK